MKLVVLLPLFFISVCFAQKPDTKGYRYEISYNGGFSHESARKYCKNKGGDLAFHNLDTIEKRKQIICEDLMFCDVNESSRYLRWGLQKHTYGDWWWLGKTTVWKYADGTRANDEDVLWVTPNQKTRKGKQCGLIHVYGDGSPVQYVHLGNYDGDSFKAFSEECDLIVGHMHAFCEFEI